MTQQKLFGKEMLMIHKYKPEYLDLPLDDYTITFDDGLYSAYQGCFDIIEKFPDIKIVLFISTGIIHGINQHAKQTLSESNDAHQNFFETGDTRDFLTMDQIVELSRIKNITIGVHGHAHLHIDALKRNRTLNDQMVIHKADNIGMLKQLTLWLIDRVIYEEVIYCTPYNIYSPMFHAMMKKQFDDIFPRVPLTIVGPGRLDIERLQSDLS